MAYQMYVSLQGDNRIMRFLMNPDTGALESVGAVDVSGGPAPMTFNPTNTIIPVGLCFRLTIRQATVQSILSTSQERSAEQLLSG